MKTILMATVGFILGFSAVCLMTGCGQSSSLPGEIVSPVVSHSPCQVEASLSGAVISCNEEMIIPIQLCPAKAFPVIGLCINREIYTSYWRDGYGFMDKLSPGHYKISKTCSFTVLSNCVVQ